MDDEFDDYKDLSWSEYVCERCKKLFNTDNLKDDRVLEYVIQNTKRDKHAVRIEEDDLLPFIQWNVLVIDEENRDWNFCIYVAPTKEDCEKWVKENNLTLAPDDV